MNTVQNTRFPRRQRIGLLTHCVWDEYGKLIWDTLLDEAEKFDVDVLCIAGHELENPHNFMAQANRLFDLAGHDNLDGLIVVSGPLSNHIEAEGLQRFCERYRPLSMVSIAVPLQGIPTVRNDNYHGIYEATTHLIQHHGYRRIAFVRGPLHNAEAECRHQAFVDAMTAHGISVDENLVSEPYEFWVAPGTAILPACIEKHLEELDAAIAVNDHHALNIMEVLHRRGLRVPDDLALVGFDNMDSGLASSPPLTSVDQSLKEQTETAFEILLKCLRGEPVEMETVLPSRLIVRESCGCREQQFLYTDLISLSQTTAEPIRRLDSGLPQEQLSKHALRALINEHAQILQDARNLRELGLEINAILNVPGIGTALSQAMPQLRIPRGYFSLYEENTDQLKWGRLAWGYRDGQHLDPAPEGQRFPLRRLSPEGIWSDERRASFILLALFFKDHQLGILLLEIGPRRGQLYHSLRDYISSALHSALLTQKEQEQAQKLAAAYKEIRFLNNQLQQENLRMRTEMELAQRIQMSLLPPTVKNIHPDFDIAAVMLPAEEVGGDYYDVALDQEGALWLGIGDVAGHGVTAGLIMMMAQTIHTAITSNYHISARDLVIRLNNALYKNVQGRLKEETFMTFITLKYVGEGRFQYAGAHDEPIVYRRKTGSCERIETPGIWLNFMPDISEHTENSEMSLELGDTLVLYSDGLTEAWNGKNGEEYLNVGRFSDIVARHAEKPVEAMRDSIIRDVFEWSEHHQADDMSLVIVRRIR